MSISSGLEPIEQHFEDKQWTPLELYVEIMERVSRHTSLGGDWREVVKGMRLSIVQLYRSMSLEEKNLFLRHGKTLWDAHWHGLPPETHEVVIGCINKGQGKVLAGRITCLQTDSKGRVLATFSQIHKEPEERAFDFVINCTGPNTSVVQSSNPFMLSLLKAGLVQPGDTGWGLKVSEDGHCIGRDGCPNPIFVCGPDLRDRDFLATAVTELKRHAQTTAQNLLSSLD